MEKNSIKKDSVNWSEMRARSLIELKRNNNRENVYEIIKINLFLLGDNHSFFLTKESLNKIYNKKNELPKISYEKINNDIAYIAIPSFLGDKKHVINFAKQIQNRIKILDSNKTEKWIIDLRKNGGGNMWPMYLGLTPILKDGVSGYFLNSKGEYTEWAFKENSVFEGKSKMLELKNPYKIKADRVKIAVLIGSKTGSSGEAIALMFKNFPNTSLFGEDSYGVSTGNEVFDMTDGAKIVLTTSIFVDRTKKEYGKKINPDVYSVKPKLSAIEWLEKE